MSEVKIAVIGGSGIYQMEGMKVLREINIETPFGKTSDSIVIGDLDGIQVGFLPRHGRGHRLNPSEIPARANFYALKSIGVEQVISVSAVGSLREEIQPLHLVVPDQLIDRTKGRVSTFFNEGIVAHVAFADPFCPVIRTELIQCASEIGATVHSEGTYVVMEGPAFSTRAESHLYRSWGASIIGMTALPEAKLAREAEICYATIACATDYDVWREGSEDVSVEQVVANLLRNAETSQSVLRRMIPKLPSIRNCVCVSAMHNGIITDQKMISPEVRGRLRILLPNEQ